MAELVFNVGNIFNAKNSDGCLGQYDADNFHIPAYQRGYKWASLRETDPVQVLLNDLYEAFQLSLKQPDKEYYLQYITVKRPLSKRHLEVIDGQQRLTTLSILLSVLFLKMEKDENPSENKIDYAIRKNFFEAHIYPTVQLRYLLSTEWQQKNGIVLKETIDGREQAVCYNNQDVYYISQAAKEINKFISQEIGTTNIESFSAFVLKRVMLIVNGVENYVNSEKVFNNLNSNKVPLTESDLIKALVLTKSPRRSENGKENSNFKEIIEQRASMGRIWDEISRYINDKEIRTFFFDDLDGMDGLLTLVAMGMDYKKKKSDKPEHLPLFNFFHKANDTKEVFDKLKKYYLMLKSWFDQDKIYNLLGYVIYAKSSRHKRLSLLNELVSLDKKEFINTLTIYRNSLLGEPTKQLCYENGSSNLEIHRILLGINVFSPNNTEVSRFNFYAFKNTDTPWSLEHIFSQKPEGLNKQLNEDDRACIVDMLGEHADDKIIRILGKKTRTDQDKEYYYDVLQQHNLINNIGNMALLTGEDNSSNSNGQFDFKRTNILKLVRNGSFVPKHTFEVFSKLILKTPGNLRNWGRINIEEHQDYIIKTIKAIININGI